MFTLFERLLKPTDLPEEAEPPPGFIAFFWHFARQAKGLFVALFAAGFVVALLDSTIPVFMGRIVTLITATPPRRAVRDILAAPPRHGGGAAGRAAAGAGLAEPDRQPGDRGQRVEPHPLAEPLVRGAPVLGVLPERFRRPHRQPRDADRAGDPRDAGRADHERLVHPGLRHERAHSAQLRRSGAGAAGRAVVPRLSGDAARAGAAHARPLQGRLGRALDAHRAHRRQLHQHPDGEAVRPRARGGRLCARRHRSAHRAVLSVAAAQHAVQLLPVHAQRHDGDRHRRARARAVDARQGRGRDRGDGAAARLADRERRRLGRAAGHVDLREYRRDPGGHDDHRPADHAASIAPMRRRSR